MRLSRPAAVAIVALTSLSLATGATASQRQPSPNPEAISRDRTAVSTVLQMDADESRRALEEVFKQYPPTLPRVLRMDPTLLNNDAYLEPYPQLAAFLKQHPEVAHNPNFFLSQYGENNSYYRETPQDRAINMWRETIQGFTIASVVLAVV